jgi:RNA polymerase sigma factor (sigma-70 family)
MAPSPTDAELVARARRGDRSAFARLAERHAPAVRRACRRVLGDADAASDAAQDAVLTAMLSLHGLRDDHRFGAWLVGIGLNHSRHMLRERRAYAPVPDDAASAEADLDEALDARRAAARIRAAIATLPAGQRAAVELFYLAGLTQAEAAIHLGVDPGAVKARLHKARRSLRARLVSVWKEEFAMTDPVPVRVLEVHRAGDEHVVLLGEQDGDRRLTIWVGAPEATQIALAIEEVEMRRPSAHHLMASLLGATGSGLREVRITRLAESIFYADLVLTDGTRVDARPSDGIALALIAGAPLLVAAEVLEAGGGPDAPVFPAAEADDRHVLVAETRDRLARQEARFRAP